MATRFNVRSIITMNRKLKKNTMASSTCHGKTKVLENEVQNASISYNKLKKNENYLVDDTNNVTILFLNKGNATFKSNHQIFDYNEKAVFVTNPKYKVEVIAKTECEVIEIEWYTEKPLDENNFPYTRAYLNCKHYRDASKSDKTISRMVIPNDIIPGFSLGSVQTTGVDRIGKHCHPTQDQIFFSFDNNDIKLLIDDDVATLEENTFIHIPLASSHGVEVDDKKVAHYLWVDFEVPQKN